MRMASLRFLNDLLATSLVVSGLLLVGSVVGAATNGPEQIIDQLAQAVRTAQALAQRDPIDDVGSCRDPLQPLVDQHGQVISVVGLSGDFLVQGIVWSNQRPLAVIDDEVVGVGDVVGPYTVLEIRADGVLVQQGTETSFLPLYVDDHAQQGTSEATLSEPLGSATPNRGSSP